MLSILPDARFWKQYEWLDEFLPELPDIDCFVQDKQEDIKNPIEQVAPGLWKIGNAYTGDAGAKLADEHIRKAFKQEIEDTDKTEQNDKLDT